MSTNERLLAEAREATATQLMRLASHGAHFIAQALAREPELRPQAVRFAQAADAALKRNAPAADSAQAPAPAARHDQFVGDHVPDVDETDRAA